MTRRTRGREIALQVLYQTEQNPGLAPEAVRRFIERRLRGDQKLCSSPRRWSPASASTSRRSTS